MSSQVNPMNATTGRVRLSYVHLSKPHANMQGQEPKYSVTVLLPKNDIAAKQRIDAAINAAIQKGVSDKWKGVRPPIIGLPVHDGDGARPSDGMPFGSECKGHWVFTASSRNQVEIVDINLNPIVNPTEIYSGIYARVSIQFFPYDNSGKKGIGCGLGPVQKLEDGESLAGGISAAAAFGDNSTGYAAPQPQAYPQQPAYGPQPPVYGQQQPQAYPQQPAYGPQPPVYGQQQPQQAYTPQQPYPQQMPVYNQQQPVDPITGKPISGGVMGI